MRTDPSELRLHRRELRQALGAFTTGVTVVATCDPSGRPIGFTANSFTSVSLDPPLVVVFISRQSRSLPVFCSSESFAVSVLSESQREIAQRFAAPVTERFSDLSWSLTRRGTPVINGAAAFFGCARWRVDPVGDHIALYGLVEEYADHGIPGLVFARGAYVTAETFANALDAIGKAEVAIGCIASRDDDVLLDIVSGGEFRLPSVILKRGRGAVATLRTLLLDDYGLSSEFGFLYAVYDGACGRQHLFFLANLGSGAPRRGILVPIDSPEITTRLADPAERSMLLRFRAERRTGAFGVYCGDAEHGEVRRLLP